MEIRSGWTRQVAATALLVAACGAAGTLVACNDSTGPGVAGSYQLTAVNGHALPATVSWGAGEVTVGSGHLALATGPGDFAMEMGADNDAFTLELLTQEGQTLAARHGWWTSSGTGAVLHYSIPPSPSTCPGPVRDDTLSAGGRNTLTLPSRSLPPCLGSATFTFRR